MRPRTKIVLVIVVATFATWVIWRGLEDYHYRVGFEKIATGLSKKDVVANLDHPNHILSGCGYLGVKLPPDCAEEDLYFAFWGFLAGEVWSIRFDKDRHVISKYHFVSP